MKVNIVNIIIMFIVLAILASLIYRIFGVHVQYDVENFTFSNPGDCKNVCRGNMYKQYCNSPYLKDGPEALCNCSWNSNTLTCDGTRAMDTKCAI